MVESQEEKADQFGFTPEGEALGYMSLDQALVEAMRGAMAIPGAYDLCFRRIPMAFEVAGETETEDHHAVTSSFRPRASLPGTPGLSISSFGGP